MKIVIAGGSGQVGTILARHFYQQAQNVVILSRTQRELPWRTAIWDGTTLGPWLRELDGSDVLINLTGRSVNCRYSEDNRAAILQSRVLSTKILHQAVATLKSPPAVWLNASTATIYRHALDRPMDEVTGDLGGQETDVPDSWRFSVRVAKAWEEAFFAVATPGTRQVALRSAMTFSPDPGGVFDVFLRLIRFGLGGTNLPGNQFVSWIHEVDFARSVDFLISDTKMEGAFNLSSPHPLPNREFLRTLRDTWGIRIGLPTTRLILEMGTFLMRTESELVLKSRQVIPNRLLQAGFTFNFPLWSDAAKDLVARWRQESHERAG